MPIAATLLSIKIVNVDKIFETDRVDFISILTLTLSDTGIFGSIWPSNVRNAIDYVTISVLGNAIDFGDLTVGRASAGGASNDSNDRGVFGGGYDVGEGERVNTIDYVTISVLGNATDFGDLTVVRDNISATSNGTNERGVFGGGVI